MNIIKASNFSSFKIFPSFFTKACETRETVPGPALGVSVNRTVLHMNNKDAIIFSDQFQEEKKLIPAVYRCLGRKKPTSPTSTDVQDEKNNTTSTTAGVQEDNTTSPTSTAVSEEKPTSS